MRRLLQRRHTAPRPAPIPPLSHRSITTRMLDLIERSLGPRIEVRAEMAADLPAACVDPNQLEVALLNLAVNARDAMRGDGYVEVREGIAEGDKVVVAANFLIDAESNLKAALQGLAAGDVK